MIGKGTGAGRSSQIGHMVRNGKGTATKPNTPISFAPRAQILVRFGRALHMQDHLVFGLVWGVGRDW
jgi:hypothetical protein